MVVRSGCKPLPSFLPLSLPLSSWTYGTVKQWLQQPTSMVVGDPCIHSSPHVVHTFICCIFLLFQEAPEGRPPHFHVCAALCSRVRWMGGRLLQPEVGAQMNEWMYLSISDENTECYKNDTMKSREYSASRGTLYPLLMRSEEEGDDHIRAYIKRVKQYTYFASFVARSDALSTARLLVEQKTRQLCPRTTASLSRMVSASASGCPYRVNSLIDFNLNPAEAAAGSSSPTSFSPPPPTISYSLFPSTTNSVRATGRKLPVKCVAWRKVHTSCGLLTVAEIPTTWMPSPVSAVMTKIYEQDKGHFVLYFNWRLSFYFSTFIIPASVAVFLRSWEEIEGDDEELSGTCVAWWACSLDGGGTQSLLWLLICIKALSRVGPRSTSPSMWTSSTTTRPSVLTRPVRHRAWIKILNFSIVHTNTVRVDGLFLGGIAPLPPTYVSTMKFPYWAWAWSSATWSGQNHKRGQRSHVPF